MKIERYEANGTVDVVNAVHAFANAQRPQQAIWYRGSSCSHHKLLPSLMRATDRTADQAFEREASLITMFRQRSLPFWPEGYPQNDWEHMFSMQHHGIETRLLDWTENAFVGLWFALEKDCDADHECCPVMWLLDPQELNRISLGHVYEKDSRVPVLTTADEDIKPFAPATVSPPPRRIKSAVAMFGTHNSARISAQRGVFTVAGKDLSPIEGSIGESSGHDSPVLAAIDLRGDASQFRHELDILGFTTSMMYPDLPGLAKELADYMREALMPATENPLETQLGKRRAEIMTESYPISIGELTNMFREGELNVRPEFQRVYRWDNEQKSGLVESILLGIPLPSIFVAQDETGKWDLVDGLQRVSTLLELQGFLTDIDGNTLPPLTLTPTKFLTALDGLRWEDADPLRSLTQAQRLDIKRAKLDVKIIKRTSAVYAKYELFQRLNSYGAQLTPQELRNCLIVSINPKVLDWLEDLAAHPAFLTSVSLPDGLIAQQYQLELVLRFIVLHNLKSVNPQELRSLGSYLDDAAIRIAETTTATERAELGWIFTHTFDTIADAGGEELLKRWNPTKNRFQGAFLASSFEVIALGLGYCIANKIPATTDLPAVARDLWTNQFVLGQSSGKSAERRIAENLPLGRQLVRA